MQNFELNCEKNAFVLAWSASIWKRIWRCVFLYCDHKNIPITSSIVIKCLKYNVLCPTGIVAQILPFLEKALVQGFLMPKEYEKNEYVKRAIRLFGEAYRIVKDSNSENNEKKAFIREFSSTICTDKEQYRREEEKDIISIPGFISKNINSTKHYCTFCDLVDAWDIDLSLYTPQSYTYAILLQNLIINSFET
jgi:hypothetical protein